jgi:NAD(P)-dependent dehydrogenase (short-subunit alcohol dehydrogenase family)
MKTNTVVITGSTRGIGFGLARQFLMKGCSVVIKGTGAAGVEKEMLELSAFSRQLHGVVSDISGSYGVERLCTEALNRFSSVDIWINNAGVGQPQQKIWELEAGMPEKIAAVNVMGVVHGTIIPFRFMQKQG